MIPDFDDIPLPHGWVEEFHDSGHPYYVDTLENPPRSIWIHPYEDEQYLQQHPEDRGKLEAWMTARSRSPSPSLDTKPPLYAEDFKVPIVPEGSNQEFYNHRSADSPALGMTARSPFGDRGLIGDRGMGGGARGLGGLLGGGGLLSALTGRAEMAGEGRGDYYDSRFGIGGGPGMIMGQRGFGLPMDRRAMDLDILQRRAQKYERRMQRREDKFERRMERSGGRYAPPSYARPTHYPGQYSSEYGQPFGGQYYGPPPQAAMPPKQEHHGGKVLPFLGGMAVGVAGDELFHHFKDKEDKH
ncbi:hypothetical protein J3R30DRAFT_3680447 [Lentinula aciculospora]|uniref:WW domain-containing protein n=1 Tax=Lentinula aciculospora TaxID=153920 RepID=A0A9W9ALS2_9AGAR|nr:hypothetical protein J3R30DRAFT_3680447 [Lentinula aciculospora]